MGAEGSAGKEQCSLWLCRGPSFQAPCLWSSEPRSSVEPRWGQLPGARVIFGGSWLWALSVLTGLAVTQIGYYFWIQPPLQGTREEADDW